MKKHTEKPPIDELFARKLGSTSLQPSSDGFARLQARMGQQKPEAKLVFWRNPVMQRYMAAAACLLLVCLFGWLYRPSTENTEQTGNQLATNQLVKPSVEKPHLKQGNQFPKESVPEITEEADLGHEVTTSQVAISDKAGKITSIKNGKTSPKAENSYRRSLPEVPQLAQTKSDENKPKNDVTVPVPVAPAINEKTEQVADNKPVVKPMPVTERVLLVTIAEPEALVAARQIAKASIEEKTALAQNEKPAKETKASGLWQQVKRIKEGDVFARQDNPNNDESGLLGRAYNGLKHSLEKDKTTKQ